jgi:EAL domain-containing protein (putative c-di-GMP-specific phosphodiesterase class I)
MSNEKTEGGYLVSVAGTASGWDKPQEKFAKAFAQSEFILFSQSIVKLVASEDRRPHFEIFVRLLEEEKHLIPPGSFLEMLEQLNLGPELDRYVVRKLLAWHRSLRPELRGVAHLNLCSSTLGDPAFCAFVGEELKKSQIGADALCFEFPGHESNYPASAAALAEGLAKVGCRISVGAMDDESIPFRLLKDLNANVLKIGGRLIRELADNEEAAEEVKAAAGACRSINVLTIAQGVESAPTLNALRKLNVNYAQGYGISRPGPLGKAPAAQG